MSGYDAVIVGGGHNGLVGHCTWRARADRSRSSSAMKRWAAAIAGAEITLPGFVHDLCSMNQNLFLGSAAYADFQADLARLGVTFRTTSRPYSNVFPGPEPSRVPRSRTYH